MFLASLLGARADVADIDALALELRRALDVAGGAREDVDGLGVERRHAAQVLRRLVLEGGDAGALEGVIGDVVLGHAHLQLAALDGAGIEYRAAGRARIGAHVDAGLVDQLRDADRGGVVEPGGRARADGDEGLGCGGGGCGPDADRDADRDEQCAEWSRQLVPSLDISSPFDGSAFVRPCGTRCPGARQVCSTAPNRRQRCQLRPADPRSADLDRVDPASDHGRKFNTSLHRHYHQASRARLVGRGCPPPRPPSPRRMPG